MKLIYVASPYAGDVKRNLEYAKAACRIVMDSGRAFFAPHLLYPGLLDDRIPQERQLGMDMGHTVLARYDELWVFGSTVSPGMRTEMEEAERLGIPIRKMELEVGQDVSTIPSMTAPC
nr:DUF4406 domain-containing protein [uncultured Oscillibacter sp.]